MLDNAQISELLACEAEQVEGVLQRAYRRASRMAWLWPEEAQDLFDVGRS